MFSRTFDRQIDRKLSEKRAKHIQNSSLVYLLLPLFREELQEAFLELFTLFFGQFSVYLSVDFSTKISKQYHYFLLKSLYRPFKGPNKPPR